MWKLKINDKKRDPIKRSNTMESETKDKETHNTKAMRDYVALSDYMTEVKSDESSEFSYSDEVVDENYNDNLRNTTVIPKMDVNKRILLVGSRKISRLHKKFILDIFRLFPHIILEKKIERKKQFIQIQSLLISTKCQWAIYIETTKRNLDRSAVALWLISYHGYRIKLILQYLHTSYEVKMTGNNVLFSRGLVSFDRKLDERPELAILKTALFQIFSIDTANHEYKPFTDHIYSFTLVGSEVHFRHYEMIPTDKNAVQSAALDSQVESGPRFSFCLSKIFVRNTLVFHNQVAIKNSVSKNEINDLKRKRKLKKNSNIKNQQLNQKMTSDNPNRTLMINKVLNYD